jgi:hypothetical protein
MDEDWHFGQIMELPLGKTSNTTKKSNKGGESNVILSVLIIQWILHKVRRSTPNILKLSKKYFHDIKTIECP